MSWWRLTRERKRGRAVIEGLDKDLLTQINYIFVAVRRRTNILKVTIRIHIAI